MRQEIKIPWYRWLLIIWTGPIALVVYVLHYTTTFFLFLGFGKGVAKEYLERSFL